MAISRSRQAGHQRITRRQRQDMAHVLVRAHDDHAACGPVDAIALQPGIDQASLATSISFDRATIGGVIDRLERKALGLG